MALLNLLDMSHVALNVTDIKESAAFYKNILGLESLFEEVLPDGIGYSRGFITPSGVTIELIQITGLDIKAKELTSTIAFSVSDVEAAKETLQNEGVEVLNEMDVMGVKMFFIKDPDGHNVEICELPNNYSQASQIHQ